MSIKLTWLSALALSLFIGHASFACATDKPASTCGCKHSLSSSQMAEKLSLTDEQKVKVHAIKSKAHNDIKSNYQQLRSLRTQINALIISDKMDEAKLNNLISQRAQIKASLMKNRVLVQHEIYSLLNDKQKTQYQSMMRK